MTQTATAIRPFRFTASDEALADLRRRVAATIWPDRETVAAAQDLVRPLQCGVARPRRPSLVDVSSRSAQNVARNSTDSQESGV
jgi:hypothetical protein